MCEIIQGKTKTNNILKNLGNKTAWEKKPFVPINDLHIHSALAEMARM